MNSEQLFEKSLKLVPGGVHSPVRSFRGLHATPRFIQKTQNDKIYDVDGKNYIDFCMSFGPLILGHRNAKVEEAIIEAVKRGWSYGACEPYSLELAEYIVERIPFIEQIRFMNSGTEAVMTALRLARGYTKKNKILKFDGCYHGHLDSMLIKAGSGLAGTASSSSAGVSDETAGETLICSLASQQAVEKIFKDHKNEIAAIIVEPLPANNGLLIQDNHFLAFLREITKKNQSLLIFDEVISGFRVGFKGMANDVDITPDIVTYGKIIGGGMPVGAVAAKAEIMQHLAPAGSVYQAGTLSANPVAMAAGLATLKQLDEKFYKDLNAKSQEITTLLSQWMKENGFEDYSITSYKSLFWPAPLKNPITQIEQIPTTLAERFKILFKTLLEKGIYLSPNGYEIGFISSAHDVSELKKRLWN